MRSPSLTKSDAVAQPATVLAGTSSNQRRLLIALLLALILLPLAVFEYPPFQDFPQWVFDAYLTSLLLTDPSRVLPYFDVAGAFVPNSAFSVVSGTLIFLGVSPLTAGKLFLALAICASVLGPLYLIRSVQGRITSVELLPFVWAYGWYVQMGYANYVLSLGLALLAIGYAHRATEAGSRAASARAIAYLSLLSIATCFSHLLGWVSLSVGLSAFALHAVPRAGVRGSMRLLSSLLPAAGLVGWYVLGRADEVPARLYSDLAAETVLKFLVPVQLFIRIDPFGLQMPSPALLNVVAILVVMGLVVSLALRRDAALGVLPTLLSSPVAMAGIASLLLALLLPFHSFGGLMGPGERFVLPGLWMALASVRYRVGSAAHLVAVLLLFGVVLFGNVRSFSQAQIPLREARDVSLGTLPSDSRVLSITLRGEGQMWSACARPSLTDRAFGVDPLNWFDLYRGIQVDVVDASIFGSALLIPKRSASSLGPKIRVRIGPSRDPDGLARMVTDQLESYDYVQVFGCPDDLRALATRTRGQATVLAAGPSQVIVGR